MERDASATGRPLGHLTAFALPVLAALSPPALQAQDHTTPRLPNIVVVHADIVDLVDPSKRVTAHVVIDGFDKLILPGTTQPRRAHAAAPTVPELFDLRADPLETTDLAARRPETVARLQALQQAFWSLR